LKKAGKEAGKPTSFVVEANNKHRARKRFEIFQEVEQIRKK
jgi:hypothetical protein